MSTLTIKPVLIPANGVQAGQRLAAGAWRRLQHWQSLAEQRRQLARLTTEQLYDIGVTPEQARIEAAKPFWRD